MNFRDTFGFTQKLKSLLSRCVIALILVCLLTASFFALDDPTNTTIIITNRAEATYQDEAGNTHSTVSPIVSVSIIAVPAITVTPDETTVSQTISPNARITREFSICNSGNSEDTFLPTHAEVSAPASIVAIYFDNDNSSTVNEGDTTVQIGQTLTPRLSPGICKKVLFVIDTNSVAAQSQVLIKLTAQSTLNVLNGEPARDSGLIINAVGSGVVFTSPTATNLPPVKLVENLPKTIASAGQTLNYSIAFRNNGTVAATQVRVSDDLPDQLEYIPGTLRLNNRSLTDIADADEGVATTKHLELLIPEIAADAVTLIQFQARLAGKNSNGNGVINTATIVATNAPQVISSEAIAVINPVGTVFAGNSGGSIRVSGAQITIATDENGTPLTLIPNNGFAPNLENVNPFSTNENGDFAFALANNQIGASSAPVRYFVNITTPNFRSRLIEVIIQPSGASGFFKANIRALDGQAIAIANGFTLTNTAVEIDNLGALVFNIPLFEISNLEISKNADKQTAEIGDIVSYKIQVKNATASLMQNTTVRDRLPASFAYAAGTTEIEVGKIISKTEPEANNGEIVFNVGDLAAGSSANISYRVRIGASATEGDHINSANATGMQSNGEQITTQPARALVRVKSGVFTMRQIVIGRVFEDRNGNGNFDKGERPVSGARIYMNNGQSVITDSAGQYNFPAVNSGTVVLSLDPVTVPQGYHLQNEAGRKSTKSWTRLLKTPLGGGSLLRQNFAVAPDNATTEIAKDIKIITINGSLTPDSQVARTKSERKDPLQIASIKNKIPLNVPNNNLPENTENKSTETFTEETAENIEPISAGAVRVLSPNMEEVIMAPALSIKASVAKEWTIAAIVNGERIDSNNIGETRIDNRNGIATYQFVGVNLQPGENIVRLTAVGANGELGETSELKIFGRGAVERFEVIPAKDKVPTDGLNAVNIEIRAFDRWGNPAADSLLAVTTSAGRFVVQPTIEKTGVDSADLARQQVIQLKDGVASVQLVGDGSIDSARLKVAVGDRESISDIRFTPEMRPTLLVGLAEFSIGKNAPEIASTGDEANTRGRLAFYYRGKLFNNRNLLTLAYNSQSPLNRIAGRDRFGDFDPLDRAYPIFGDSSQRFEDAQSNSKVYARLDRGRSYVMFGDMEADLDNLTLSGYGRRLTGAKIRFENDKGDFISLTGARPDTAFARDVIPGGGLSLTRLSHKDVLAGSEIVALEVRDRRNPEIIIKREQLIRSVDYNLDVRTGEIFFLRPISTFDYSLNLTQIVVTYEYHGGNASNYVYTGRINRNFRNLGLRLGASYINQQQSEIGAFQLGGVDVEKSLWKGGKLSFEAAISRGRFATGVNVFDFYNPENSTIDNDASAERNGVAIHIKLEQPLPFLRSRLRADFRRAEGNFFNPFGNTVTAGTQRFDVAFDINPKASRILSFGFTDERNKTANVSNSRTTFSGLWTEQWHDKVRTAIGFNHRRYSDDLTNKTISSNLFTAGIEYRPIEKLELSVKREQNIGEADPTYPNQTMFALKYRLNQNAKLFFTQRLASAAITPIADFSGSGFASVASKYETAVGIETNVSRLGAINGRYQLENGVNGTDSFAVFGLQNRWTLTKTIDIEAGFERGFLLKGEGKSFNTATIGASWMPVDGFKTSARYEFRDRNGLGQLLAVGAVGKIGENWTTAARLQWMTSSFNGRDAASSNISASAAYRPIDSDKYALLFSYNNRNTAFTSPSVNGILQAAIRDRSDTLSADGLYQVSKSTEIYGRFALRFGGNGNNTTAYASALTYLSQIRAQQRLNNLLDLAIEARMLNQPLSDTFRRSVGAELGFWVLPDLRLGAGYNFSQANRNDNLIFNNDRQNRGGFYFTITSKLSNLFDLFGTSRQGLEADKNSDTDKSKDK